MGFLAAWSAEVIFADWAYACATTRLFLAMEMRPSTSLGLYTLSSSFKSLTIDLIRFFESCESYIVKLDVYPRCSASTRRILEKMEWKVPIHKLAALPCPTRVAIRFCISRAALLVNVSARIRYAGTPLLNKFAIRYVNTLVLPDPAPAITSVGPSVFTTASRWFSFNSLIKSTINKFRKTFNLVSAKIQIIWQNYFIWDLCFISFIKLILWQATIPAVSVRRRLSPRVTGMKLFSKASVISFPEKSPSGPMRIVISWPG